MQTLSGCSMVSLQSSERSRSHFREAVGSSVVGGFLWRKKTAKVVLEHQLQFLYCIGFLFQYASFNGAVTTE